MGNNENKMENTVAYKAMENKSISEVKSNPKNLTNQIATDNSKTFDNSKTTKLNLISSNQKNWKEIINDKTKGVENLSKEKEIGTSKNAKENNSLIIQKSQKSSKSSNLTKKVLRPSNNIENIKYQFLDDRKLRDSYARANNTIQNGKMSPIDKLQTSDMKYNQRQLGFDVKVNQKPDRTHIPKVHIDKKAYRRLNLADKTQCEGTNIDAFQIDDLISDSKDQISNVETSICKLVSSEKATEGHNSVQNLKLTNVQIGKNIIHLPDNQHLTNTDVAVHGHNEILYAVNENQNEIMKFECCIDCMKHEILKDGSILSNMKCYKPCSHNIESLQLDSTESSQIVSDKERNIFATNSKLNMMVNSEISPVVTSYEKSEFTSDNSQRKNQESKSDSYKETFHHSHNENNKMDKSLTNEFLLNFDTNIKLKDDDRSSRHKSTLLNNKSYSKSTNFNAENFIRENTVRSILQNEPVTTNIVNKLKENEHEYDNTVDKENKISTSSKYLYQKHDLQINLLNHEIKPESQNIPLEPKYVKRTVINKKNQNNQEIFNNAPAIDNFIENKQIILPNVKENPINDKSKFEEDLQVSKKITSILDGTTIDNNLREICVQSDMDNNINIPQHQTENKTDNFDYSRELSKPSREYHSELTQNKCEKPIQNASNISENGSSNQRFDSVPSHFNLNSTNTGKVIVSNNCHNEVTEATETNISKKLTDQNLKQVIETELRNYKFKDELFVNHEANKYIDNYVCGRGNENNLPIGFKNPSGYCYLNSVVQVIVSCQIFTKDLETYDQWDSVENDNDTIFVRDDESSLNFSVSEKSGLKNTQGYCVLNSVLQVLRGCKSFNNAIIRYHNESRILYSQESNENKVVITKFCKLMNDLKENRNVEDCVACIQNYFQSSSTENDLNQCFMNLLTVVKNVTRDPQPKGPISNDAESKFEAFKKANYGFVFDCFFGQMEHRMTCETCQKSINRNYQLFNCLLLHVPISKSTVPLMKIIKEFFQKTKIEIDDPMKCDCVNGTVNISSQFQITHSPKYLFIFLDKGSLLVDDENKSTFIISDESLSINKSRI